MGMTYSTLGRTGIRVSRLAFGAGPVSGLMTSSAESCQQAVLSHAISSGINWIDTAPGYGDGESELRLGIALDAIGADERVALATKVRVQANENDDLNDQVQSSLGASLRRLRRTHVTLLQVHNSITARPGDEPSSITPDDILRRGGLLDCFRRAQRKGLAKFIGITAIGDPAALREVVDADAFDTIQVPYNLLNPSAGRDVEDDFGEANYGNVIAGASQKSMGVFAIRVLAGGALAGQPPSAHTATTRYFPLDLYRRDQQRAEKLRRSLPNAANLSDAAIRFSLSHPQVHSAIIGFSAESQIDAAAACI